MLADVQNRASTQAPLHSYVLESLPVALPHGSINNDQDFDKITRDFVNRLSSLDASDFAKTATWRDSMALTGTFRTFFSGYSIITAWKKLCHDQHVRDFASTGGSARVIRTPGGASWVTVDFTFLAEREPARTCVGSLYLVPDSENGWKIWMLTTVIDQLSGHPNVDRYSPRRDEVNGNQNVPQHHLNSEKMSTDFDAVIIGAGQAGLAVAGRLKALGVSYLVVDQMEEIGDNWSTRYRSTRLHTPREFAHLPFERTFQASEYQEYLDKNDLARGFREWVKKLLILTQNIWLSTRIISGQWFQDSNVYQVDLSVNGRPVSISSSHVVLATGGYGPQIFYPQYEDREKFIGTVIHTQGYKDAMDWKGKKGIVIGTANTAHDVAQDMFTAGLSSVTMVQRGQTYVLPVQHFKAFSDFTYNSHIPTDKADRMSYSNPWSISRLYLQDFLHNLAAKEPQRFDDLANSGFKVERHGDLTYQLTVRRGGHYIDVGTSEKISEGLIKVKSDSLPVKYTETGLLFADGSHISADVIVFATGFSGNLRDTVEELFGPEVATRGGIFWGLDEEGELKGAFKPLGRL
ncbi:uncharacterized protein A1O9_05149 [Exophiala aquamarina CBS 119918]|uniref:FAD/NAD(P)-binding domain-containing protein n=1 Tax=Exophiala aquamarina CBS 119918 TaxID=1182545 RepID=A0A072PLW3_9EURO|nr:uncharacterized protein A1O9_05149 [Exophiala aquamarina CBS 119918]KEF60298.1 hypothetical protein A1O9_05149 [Exophiala aquamarina CBS 119918]